MSFCESASSGISVDLRRELESGRHSSCVGVFLLVFFVCVQLVKTTVYRGNEELGFRIARFKSSSVTPSNSTAAAVEVSRPMFTDMHEIILGSIVS